MNPILCRGVRHIQQLYSCSLFSSPCAAWPRGLQCSLDHPGHRSESPVTVTDGSVLCKDGGGYCWGVLGSRSVSTQAADRSYKYSGPLVLFQHTGELESVLSGQRMLPSCRPALYWVLLWTLVPALTPPRPALRPALPRGSWLLPTYLEVQWTVILHNKQINIVCRQMFTSAPQYLIVCSNHRAFIVAFMLLVTYWITHKKGGLKKYFKKVCIFANKNLNKTYDRGSTSTCTEWDHISACRIICFNVNVWCVYLHSKCPTVR